MEVGNDVLQAALARAITDAVSDDVRKEVFKNAISQHLFSMDRNNKNVITDAFDRALKEAVYKIAEQVLNEPENKLMISELFRKSLVEAVSTGKVSDRMIEKILQSLRY